MKNICFYLLCFAIQIYSTSSVSGETPTGLGEIQGKVTDSQTGEALPFANVSIDIEGKLVGAVTDFDGIYSIPSLAPRTYNLTFRHVGYATQEIKVVYVNADKTTSLNVRLHIDKTLLCNIKVTNCTFGANQKKQAHFITPEQIQSAPIQKINLFANKLGSVFHPNKENQNLKNSNNLEVNPFIANRKMENLPSLEEVKILNYYPNPVKNQLTIESQTHLSNILLTDMSGKILQKLEMLSKGKSTIDMSYLPTGIYFIHFNDSEGSEQVERIVKH